MQETYIMDEDDHAFFDDDEPQVSGQFHNVLFYFKLIALYLLLTIPVLQLVVQLSHYSSNFTVCSIFFCSLSTTLFLLD